MEELNGVDIRIRMSPRQIAALVATFLSEDEEVTAQCRTILDRKPDETTEGYVNIEIGGNAVEVATLVHLVLSLDQDAETAKEIILRSLGITLKDDSEEEDPPV